MVELIHTVSFHTVQKKKKTRIINSTLHPVWSWSVFSFEKKNYKTSIFGDDKDKEEKGDDVINICVMDHDNMSKDDFMGRLDLSLKGTEGQVIDRWIELEPLNEGRGKIHLRVYNEVALPELKGEELGKSLFLFEDHALDKFQTGDCILYSGSELISGVLKRFMHSPYSHCGIILKMKDPLDPNATEESVFIAEADWDDGDHFGDESIYGIVINLMKDRMKDYAGDVIWHCPLKNALQPDQQKKVIDFVLKCKKEKAKYDISQGVKMMMNFKTREDAKSVFCSELVSFALKEAGVVPATLNCSLQNPFMVSKFDCYLGEHPTTVLRYQVLVDKDKVKGAGFKEVLDLLK
jgi:uncharacterized protein YbaR (Trm112 family)